MTVPSPLAALARLLADDTRAAMCLALLDGRAWTAREIADAVGVAPSTATEHLHRLVDGGVLAQERQGRHRYVRLAGPEVAALIEDLQSAALSLAAARAPGEAAAVPVEKVLGIGRAGAGSLRAARVSRALAEGRTCYDHLAGRLGVAVTDAMAARGLLDPGEGRLTPAGHVWLADEFDVALAGRRPTARMCLDWTERRPHLAGPAGARLCDALVARGWVTRTSGSRAVRVTPAGREGLAASLALTPAALVLPV